MITPVRAKPPRVAATAHHDRPEGDGQHRAHRPGDEDERHPRRGQGDDAENEGGGRPSVSFPRKRPERIDVASAGGADVGGPGLAVEEAVLEAARRIRLPARRGHRPGQLETTGAAGATLTGAVSSGADCARSAAHSSIVASSRSARIPSRSGPQLSAMPPTESRTMLGALRRWKPTTGQQYVATGAHANFY